MGLFDQIVGAFAGGSQGGATPGPVALLQALSEHEGGLDGVLQKFHAAGLSDTVNSWVGTGQNLPISPDIVHQVLGSEMMQQLAARTGLPLEQVSSMVAEHLPHVVDGVTPDGEVPQANTDLFSIGAAMLKGRFGIG